MSKLVYRTIISNEKLHAIDEIIRLFFDEICKPDKTKLTFVIHEIIVNALQAYERHKVLSTERIVEIRLDLYLDEVNIEIMDYAGGMQIDKDRMARQSNENQSLETNGRGMLFINHFVDEFTWHTHEEGGIMVRLKKKVQKASDYEYDVI